MIPSPQLGFLTGVFLANHFASTDNLTKTTFCGVFSTTFQDFVRSVEVLVFLNMVIKILKDRTHTNKN